ncbi:efflux RND transporter periplasmic adaptor subunit [Parachitinimonas caeni]|uniref:Efflux RND transporter periplasmic adaptor subunit n=1 Tax=Parachitinimonas caeni TaxID=3031301 RepID=A0ABT7DZK9_9NEIS|nr:efflux RND transporter periplasmic adaptor subunit [Parachitinimonas caeni]MDK2125259.1 efflux RND transporter periplasmic adaptor subunit [Parachitinimonas caeni]
MSRLLLVFFLFLAGWAQAAERSIKVGATQLQQQLWSDSIAAQGVIAPWQEMLLSNRLQGVALLELNAAVGEQVKRGSVLARFDDRLIQAELQKAQADLRRAEVALRQAQAERERSRSMRASGLINDQAMLNADTQADLAQAQQQAAAAQVALQRAKLSDTRLQAPDDGLVIARPATLGQVPALGGELFRLIRQNKLEWRAELTAQQLAQVKPGLAVQLQLPDGGSAQGKLRQLAGALEGQSRLGLAYVDLIQPGSAKAAMYASGQIELGRRPALVLPATAVLLRDGRPVVFKLVQGRALKQAVQTGRRQGEWVEIVQGLRPGESVVLQGAGFLQGGEALSVVAAGGK